MWPPDGDAHKRLLGVWRGIFSLALLTVVAALGQIPYGRPTGEAVLRLALRTTATRLEICRQPAEAELAALPVHMRRTEICDWVAPSYRLRVAIDGRGVLDRLVEAGGMKADRPRTVDAQMTWPPGTVRLVVRYEPDLGSTESGDRPESTPEAAPDPPLPVYRLDETVELQADRITLVQLDDRRGLEVYSER